MSSGIYVCSMYTEHYSFMAVGASEEGAKLAMVQTMRRHRSQALASGDPERTTVWHPEMYNTDKGPKWEGYPENDLEWLMWLIEDQYGAWVTGPYTLGAPGTCEGDFISVRGES